MDLLSIAGITSPWTGEDIDRWAESLSSLTEGTREEEVEALRGVMAQVTDGLGDGLVTVESTRLEGVDQVTVPGTHLSMIRNILAGSDRVPPAVPVIVEKLTRSPDRR